MTNGQEWIAASWPPTVRGRGELGFLLIFPASHVMTPLEMMLWRVFHIEPFATITIQEGGPQQ